MESLSGDLRQFGAGNNIRDDNDLYVNGVFEVS